MKKLSILITSVTLLLILGVGCTDTPTKNIPTKSSESTSLRGENIPTTTISNNDIDLTASPMGPNTVNFEWTPSKQLEDLNEGWRIIYGENENPTYPSTWWFERGASFREKLWKGLPAGDAHFRICALVDDACNVYSNDVFVTIEGEAKLSAQEVCEQTEDSVWEEKTESCFEDPETMISDEENK